ncbi:MAG: hypothetical protein K2L07_03420 [Lachnospiraceae bacterium]|nr:hypothetical protein [Lachnospiraceae bacterium]
MSVNNVSTTQANDVYSNYQSTAAKSSKEADSKETTENQAAAVYEKSDSTSTKKASYSVNKMSAKDRAALVQQLKADQASRKQSLIDLVQSMMGGQAKSAAIAKGDKDAIWKFIASGKYTVDEATKKQAQEDISEDGYWGVKQTSQRLFDFASALAGDDVEKMKEMQAAVEKGYKLAGKAWGGELPEISKNTFDATNKLFEEYYKSKGVE